MESPLLMKLTLLLCAGERPFHSGFYISTFEKTRTVLSTLYCRYHGAGQHTGNEMVSELQNLGSTLVPFLENLPNKVLVLISGDLAHKHFHSVADQPTPFGVNGLCEKFDSLVERWASDFKDTDPLIEASKLLLDCRSCGYTGFCLLSKILEEVSLKEGKEKFGSGRTPHITV